MHLGTYKFSVLVQRVSYICCAQKFSCRHVGAIHAVNRLSDLRNPLEFPSISRSRHFFTSTCARNFSKTQRPLDLTFTNSKSAFECKTTWEVLRAYLVYRIFAFDYLVENNMMVKQSLFEL